MKKLLGFKGLMYRTWERLERKRSYVGGGTVLEFVYIKQGKSLRKTSVLASIGTKLLSVVVLENFLNNKLLHMSLM